jgi:hypothetical protein
MAFSSSFRTLEMIPLRVQILAGIYVIFGGVFHARKDLVSDPNSELCFVLSLFRRRKFLSKMIHFWMYFWDADEHHIWVEFGVENKPKKESFGADFTCAGNIFLNRKTCLDVMFWSQKSFGLRCECSFLGNHEKIAISGECRTRNFAFLSPKISMSPSPVTQVFSSVCRVTLHLNTRLK